MKMLDLNAYGVSEMSSIEAQNVDGGFWWGIIVGIIISEILDRDALSDFAEGYNDAHN